MLTLQLKNSVQSVMPVSPAIASFTKHTIIPDMAPVHGIINVYQCRTSVSHKSYNHP